MGRVVLYGIFSLIIMVILIIGTISVMGLSQYKATSPPQPLSGPGGSDYNHSAVEVKVYGQGEHQYWIFQPKDPQPVSAPVIVFLHGWGATNPTFYQAWINHLVLKGNIVIYPRYQEDITTPSDNFTPNTIMVVKDALNQLETENYTEPQLDKFAIVGHSAGGLIGVNLASLAESEGIPVPKAVFAVEPGKSRSSQDKVGPVLENLTNISPSTLLLTLSGENDDWVGDQDARRIIQETTTISPENKNYLLLRSDQHGKPPLWADHFAPLAPLIMISGNNLSANISFWVDSRDYYGTWKLFDGLYMSAFYDTNREYALGNTSQQRFMGFWSDGVPVKEMEVINP